MRTLSNGSWPKNVSSFSRLLNNRKGNAFVPTYTPAMICMSQARKYIWLEKSIWSRKMTSEAFSGLLCISMQEFIDIYCCAYDVYIRLMKYFVVDHATLCVASNEWRTRLKSCGRLNKPLKETMCIATGGGKSSIERMWVGFASSTRTCNCASQRRISIVILVSSYKTLAETSKRTGTVIRFGYQLRLCRLPSWYTARVIQLLVAYNVLALSLRNVYIRSPNKSLAGCKGSNRSRPTGGISFTPNVEKQQSSVNS